MQKQEISGEEMNTINIRDIKHPTRFSGSADETKTTDPGFVIV